MQRLGAILAGGQSHRFGSDKAQAKIGQLRLLDIVAAALQEQCDALVVCGREEPACACLPDRPGPGMGPLAGLNAALHHAQAHGMAMVLSCGCDAPNVPTDLAEQLGQNGPAYVDNQPIVGLWPADLAHVCDAFLRSGGRSLYGFAEHVGARPVVLDSPLLNVNRPGDLPGQ